MAVDYGLFILENYKNEDMKYNFSNVKFHNITKIGPASYTTSNDIMISDTLYTLSFDFDEAILEKILEDLALLNELKNARRVVGAQLNDAPIHISHIEAKLSQKQKSALNNEEFIPLIITKIVK